MCIYEGGIDGAWNTFTWVLFRSNHVAILLKHWLFKSIVTKPLGLLETCKHNLDVCVTCCPSQVKANTSQASSYLMSWVAYTYTTPLVGIKVKKGIASYILGRHGR